MSASESSIPVFTLGRSPHIGKTLQDKILPEFDLVHFSTSPESAKEELNRLLSGEHVVLASGIGSNKDRPPNEQRLPWLLAIGTAFSQEEYDDMKNSIDLTGGGNLSGDQIPVWVNRYPEDSTPKGSDGQALTPFLPDGQFNPELVKAVVHTAKTRYTETAKTHGLM
ncbi:hypothetical protein TWF694_006749 [Orbilia ellipsospora]|uniref:NAD(P)-binding domain-containing protein n=1 Tax=Orbilia ellipsospora TaxID=2528407 RepID=A0AAV9XSV1_9PEZI